MDPDVRALVVVVKQLVEKVDGLLCHFTAIDADYARIKDVMQEHDSRLDRLEKEHNFEPAKKVGETSALFPAVGGAPCPPPR